MKNVSDNADDGEMRSNIPNESNLPHLHAITIRRDYQLKNNSLLKRSQVNE